jgi:hypothetical protein
MGDDFRNRQCFVGSKPADSARTLIQQTVAKSLLRFGYNRVASEDEATRSIVIGPVGRWIFVGDTTGGLETSDSDAYVALTLALSRVLPVVDVHMSDSSAVHVHQYKAGSLVDKFGNAAFPCFKFRSDKEAMEFKGNPELWAEYLVASRTSDDLRAAWVQTWGADSILSNMARLFGWHSELAFMGYTLDGEGIGIKYNECSWLKVQQGFTELHFQRGIRPTSAKAARG